MSFNNHFTSYSFSEKILQNPYSKRIRKEIRKIMKQRLSHLDKVKFTKIYELFNGKAYRESFEKLVDDQLNRFLYSKCQHNQSCNALFNEVHALVLREMMPDVPKTPPKYK
jgi:hypothetical protein